MGIGTNVAFQAQDTTTTTGTGVITITGTVPATAAPGSTTFASAFAPTGSFQLAGFGNQFYAIVDGSGNIEVGLGTLLSATTFSRDYVLGSYTGGAISLATQTTAAGYVNFAAGTKNVYSNVTLFANSVACWQRVPDDNAANIFENIMSGSFVGVVTMGASTSNVTIRYKVTNEGNCVLTFATAVTANGTATSVSITGIPAFLCNVGVSQITSCNAVTASGAQSIGALQIVAGATPTTNGTANILNGATLTATVTTATANGVVAGTCFVYPLY
jgi:hypothetical protein